MLRTSDCVGFSAHNTTRCRLRIPRSSRPLQSRPTRITPFIILDRLPAAPLALLQATITTRLFSRTVPLLTHIGIMTILQIIKNQIQNTFLIVKHHMSQANQRRIVAETRQSVHVHYRQCQFSKYAWKCREAQQIDRINTTRVSQPIPWVSQPIPWVSQSIPWLSNDICSRIQTCTSSRDRLKHFTSRPTPAYHVLLRQEKGQCGEDTSWQKACSAVCQYSYRFDAQAAPCRDVWVLMVMTWVGYYSC